MDARSPEPALSAAGWFLRGMRGILSTPAIILTLSMVGFAALAREAGLDWLQTSFITATVWALPAQLILLGAVTAGTSLPATALAVALSSVRLMPMVVALMPQLRGPGTRRRTLLFLSHFVAVTNWVFAMERLGAVPREMRTSFLAGFAVTLTTVNTVMVALLFNLMGQLPALAIGALAFLTPVYFLTSLYGTSRATASRLGLLTGIALLPLAHWITPAFDILLAGIVGGLLAFGGGRAIDRRRSHV